MDFWDANFLKNIGYSVLASFNASKKKKKIQGILQHLKILFLETFPDVLSQY